MWESQYKHKIISAKLSLRLVFVFSTPRLGIFCVSITVLIEKILYLRYCLPIYLCFFRSKKFSCRFVNICSKRLEISYCKILFSKIFVPNFLHSACSKFFGLSDACSWKLVIFFFQNKVLFVIWSAPSWDQCMLVVISVAACPSTPRPDLMVVSSQWPQHKMAYPSHPPFEIADHWPGYQGIRLPDAQLR